MGYDMRWVRKPDGEKAAVDAAREAFKVVCNARDQLPKSESGMFNFKTGKMTGGSERWQAAQDVVEARMRIMEDAERSYFRLNIWGMQVCRAIMRAFGMIEDNVEPPRDYPKAEDYGIADTDDVDTDDGPVLNAHHKRYLETKHNYLSTTGKQGIMPTFKFCSNDGWIVTPAEIQRSLMLYKDRLTSHYQAAVDACNEVYKKNRNAGEPEEPALKVLPAWWDEWITWISNAAEHDGFRVY